MPPDLARLRSEKMLILQPPSPPLITKFQLNAAPHLLALFPKVKRKLMAGDEISERRLS